MRSEPLLCSVAPAAAHTGGGVGGWKVPCGGECLTLALRVLYLAGGGYQFPDTPGERHRLGELPLTSSLLFPL